LRRRGDRGRAALPDRARRVSQRPPRRARDPRRPGGGRRCITASLFPPPPVFFRLETRLERDGRIGAAVRVPLPAMLAALRGAGDGDGAAFVPPMQKRGSGKALL